MTESFLVYKKSRYLYWSIALALLSALAFALHRATEPPSGGTWLGYTLGAIAALLIVWLILFGVRKRSYAARLGSVEGWLSAHVYLGTSLLFVGTLHSAGQLGWNIHTAAYVLMLLVIFSGFYGIYLYRAYPQRIAANRALLPRQTYLAELVALDEHCLRQAANSLPEVLSVVTSAVERTRIAGRWWSCVRGRDESRVVLPGVSASQDHVSNAGQAPLLEFLTRQLAHSNGKQAVLLKELIELCGKRKRVLDILHHDLTLQTRLRAWLLMHVPLSFGLLAALTAHIVSVFLYW